MAAFPRVGTFAIIADPGHGRCPVAIGLEGSSADVRNLLDEDDRGMESGGPLVYGAADAIEFFG